MGLPDCKENQASTNLRLASLITFEHATSTTCSSVHVGAFSVVMAGGSRARLFLEHEYGPPRQLEAQVCACACACATMRSERGFKGRCTYYMNPCCVCWLAETWSLGATCMCVRGGAVLHMHRHLLHDLPSHCAHRPLPPPPCGVRVQEEDGSWRRATAYAHTTQGNIVLWFGGDEYEGA